MFDTKLGDGLPPQIAVFDTETDGVDLEDTRIITAFLGIMETATGLVTSRWSWVLQPERPIPAGASAVHGYSTERAMIEGVDRADGISDIARRLIELTRWMPVVIMNAMYDMTILDRELGRFGWASLVERNDSGDVTMPVIFDPMVFDRAIDKYRPGKRTLVDLCKVYGVPVETNAHDAEADCRMAGRVAIKLMGHSRLADMTPSEVHAKLIPTYRSNSLSLADYWKRGVHKLAEPMRSERLAAIEDVKSKAEHWPCIPRPKLRDPDF